MICPRCGTQNPEAAAKCARCGIGLALGGDQETFAGIVPAPLQAGAGAAAPAPALIPTPSMADMATAGPWVASSPGATSGDEVNFGPRYKIQRMLGEGGMGAVYKAHDLELDRTVALKLIRPGLAMDPNVAARFKQELLLASKASHKNILRIHDLGDANGVKFISMAYVEGQDLHQLLVDNGKLGVERSVKLAKQMCAALDAAHSEGVVHRDFKPQNILLDKNEQVYVTDFGLAKSLEADAGLSRSGEFLGTPRYMAPEQVEGRGIDHRVDLYALGLIMYEMLTGDLPFHADSTIQLMYKRVNETPKTPKELNPELPDWIVRVVMKLIERFPDNRYQSANEVLADLQHQLGPTRTKSGSIAFTIRRVEVDMPGAKIGLLIAAAIVVIVAGLLAIPSVRERVIHTGPKVASSSKPISVLVADFQNHTGDPVFDATLEPQLNVALEGASFINGFNRGTARRLAHKLPNPTDKLDEQAARLVALSQSVSAVITGDITRRGENYEITAIALDAATGNVLAKAEVTANSKEDVLHKIPKLAAPLRNALGDSTPESAQIVAAGGAFNAASLEAVHQYGVGMEQQFAGKIPAALASFKKAAELDPNFARAYSGMTSATLALNRVQDAHTYINMAMQHVDHMTDREQFRIRGFYYFATQDWQKCADEYSGLVKQYPADNIAHMNLAVCFSNLRDFTKAAEQARRDYEIHPNAIAAANVSLLSSYASDFQAAERDAQRVRNEFPSYEFGYVAVAFAQLGQSQLQQAAKTYDELEKVSALGAILASWGRADVASYEGRFSKAAKTLEEGIAADLAAKIPDDAAEKLVTLATNQLWMGNPQAAVGSAEKALANSDSAKVKFLAAQVFVEAGQIAKAEKLETSLASELHVEPQAYAKIIAGDIALKKGDARAAVQSLTEANKLFDTWIGHLELGRAYLAMKLFVEADAEFNTCLKRQGEALSLFLDQVPTYGYLPRVYYLQGLARDGLKSLGAADSYRLYLNLRGAAGEDPLLAEIRKRLGN